MASRAVELRTAAAGNAPGDPETAAFETLDRVYRALCAILFNYVPSSGHPGGSNSSGRIVARVLFESLDYDLSAPARQDADVLAYAAGHKAMGLYAMWALRDEIARQAAPALLGPTDRDRLRLEDLLGFRTNPTARRPLAAAHGAKFLDGHPTPATPFVRLASGASGVGFASAVGLAIAARDHFGSDCPRIHILEGEGGLTTGRSSESLATAATASLDNVVVHLDFNQASIDSDRVCRDESGPGDYVQWTPAELFRVHGWRVLTMEDGHDISRVAAVQRRVVPESDGRPTAIIYPTTKGWRYGIEGAASHGAGHAPCSEEFRQAVSEIQGPGITIPSCDPAARGCAAGGGAEVRERCFFEALLSVRRYLAQHPADVAYLAARLAAARDRLDARSRRPRDDAPQVGRVYDYAAAARGAPVPDTLRYEPGTTVSLKDALGRSLGLLNTVSGGAILTASADLIKSTSAALVPAGFAPGFFNAQTNPTARKVSIGGICEDGIAGVLSGAAGFGTVIGVGASYGAFLAPLGHIASRLHAIGSQARREVNGVPLATLVLVCGHASMATGEDGPTHADPQALQLLTENFPTGAAVTLTPWEPQEVWPLLTAALTVHPAIIDAFVPRPGWVVPDRAALGLAPPSAAVTGVYLLRAAAGAPDVTVVLQEAAVTTVFVNEVLPLLLSDGIDVAAYYVASAELFELLDPATRAATYPESVALRAMGITGFTKATMYHWITSARGRDATLHPFRRGRYLSSGGGASVVVEAGLGAEGQYDGIRSYLDTLAASATAE